MHTSNSNSSYSYHHSPTDDTAIVNELKAEIQDLYTLLPQIKAVATSHIVQARSSSTNSGGNPGNHQNIHNSSSPSSSSLPRIISPSTLLQSTATSTATTAFRNGEGGRDDSIPSLSTPPVHSGRRGSTEKFIPVGTPTNKDRSNPKDNNKGVKSILHPDTSSEDEADYDDNELLQEHIPYTDDDEEAKSSNNKDNTRTNETLVPTDGTTLRTTVEKRVPLNTHPSSSTHNSNSNNPSPPPQYHHQRRYRSISSTNTSNNGEDTDNFYNNNNNNNTSLYPLSSTTHLTGDEGYSSPTTASFSFAEDLVNDIHEQLHERITSLRLRIFSLLELSDKPETIFPLLESLQTIGDKISDPLFLSSVLLTPPNPSSIGGLLANSSNFGTSSSSLPPVGSVGKSTILPSSSSTTPAATGITPRTTGNSINPRTTTTTTNNNNNSTLTRGNSQRSILNNTNGTPLLPVLPETDNGNPLYNSSSSNALQNTNNLVYLNNNRRIRSSSSMSNVSVHTLNTPNNGFNNLHLSSATSGTTNGLTATNSLRTLSNSSILDIRREGSSRNLGQIPLAVLTGTVNSPFGITHTTNNNNQPSPHVVAGAAVGLSSNGYDTVATVSRSTTNTTAALVSAIDPSLNTITRSDSAIIANRFLSLPNSTYSLPHNNIPNTLNDTVSVSSGGGINTIPFNTLSLNQLAGISRRNSELSTFSRITSNDGPRTSAVDILQTTGNLSSSTGGYTSSSAFYQRHVPVAYSFGRLVQQESIAELLRIIRNGPHGSIDKVTRETLRGTFIRYSSSENISLMSTKLPPKGFSTVQSSKSTGTSVVSPAEAIAETIATANARCNAVLALAHLVLDSNVPNEIIGYGGISILLNLFREASSSMQEALDISTTFQRLQQKFEEQLKKGSIIVNNVPKMIHREAVVNKMKVAVTTSETAMEASSAWGRTRHAAAYALTRVLRFSNDPYSILDAQIGSNNANAATELFDPGIEGGQDTEDDFDSNGERIHREFDGRKNNTKNSSSRKGYHGVGSSTTGNTYNESEEYAFSMMDIEDIATDTSKGTGGARTTVYSGPSNKLKFSALAADGGSASSSVPSSSAGGKGYDYDDFSELINLSSSLPHPGSSTVDDPSFLNQEINIVHEFKTAAACIALTVFGSLGNDMIPSVPTTTTTNDKKSFASSTATSSSSSSSPTALFAYDYRALHPDGIDTVVNAVGGIDGHAILDVAKAIHNVIITVCQKTDILCCELPLLLLDSIQSATVQEQEGRKKNLSLPKVSFPSISATDPIDEWKRKTATSNANYVGMTFGPILLYLIDPNRKYPPLPNQHTVAQDTAVFSEWFLHACSYQEAKRLALQSLQAITLATQRLRTATTDALHVLTKTNQSSSVIMNTVTNNRDEMKNGTNEILSLTEKEIYWAKSFCRTLSPPCDLGARLIGAGIAGLLTRWIESPVTATGTPTDMYANKSTDMQQIALSILRCILTRPHPRYSILNGGKTKPVSSSSLRSPLSTSVNKYEKSSSLYTGGSGAFDTTTISSNNRIASLKVTAETTIDPDVSARKRGGSDPPQPVKKGTAMTNVSLGSPFSPSSSTVTNNKASILKEEYLPSSPLHRSEMKSSGTMKPFYDIEKLFPELYWMKLQTVCDPALKQRLTESGEIDEVWEACAMDVVSTDTLRKLIHFAVPNVLFPIVPSASSDTETSTGIVPPPPPPSSSSSSSTSSETILHNLAALPEPPSFATGVPAEMLGHIFEIIRNLANSSVATRRAILNQGGTAILAAAAARSLINRKIMDEKRTVPKLLPNSNNSIASSPSIVDTNSQSSVLMTSTTNPRGRERIRSDTKTKDNIVAVPSNLPLTTTAVSRHQVVHHGRRRAGTALPSSTSSVPNGTISSSNKLNLVSEKHSPDLTDGTIMTKGDKENTNNGYGIPSSSIIQATLSRRTASASDVLSRVRSNTANTVLSNDTNITAIPHLRRLANYNRANMSIGMTSSTGSKEGERDNLRIQVSKLSAAESSDGYSGTDTTSMNHTAEISPIVLVDRSLASTISLNSRTTLPNKAQLFKRSSSDRYQHRYRSATADTSSIDGGNVSDTSTLITIASRTFPPLPLPSTSNHSNPTYSNSNGSILTSMVRPPIIPTARNRVLSGKYTIDDNSFIGDTDYLLHSPTGGSVREEVYNNSSTVANPLSSFTYDNTNTNTNLPFDSLLNNPVYGKNGDIVTTANTKGNGTVMNLSNKSNENKSHGSLERDGSIGHGSQHSSIESSILHDYSALSNKHYTTSNNNSILSQSEWSRNQLEVILVNAIDGLSRLASRELEEKEIEIFVGQGGLRVLLAGLRYQADEMEKRIKQVSGTKRSYLSSFSSFHIMSMDPSESPHSTLSTPSNPNFLPKRINASLYVPALSAVAQIVCESKLGPTLARATLSQSFVLYALVTMLRYVGSGIDAEIEVVKIGTLGTDHHATTTTVPATTFSSYPDEGTSSNNTNNGNSSTHINNASRTNEKLNSSSFRFIAPSSSLNIPTSPGFGKSMNETFTAIPPFKTGNNGVSNPKESSLGIIRSKSNTNYVEQTAQDLVEARLHLSRLLAAIATSLSKSIVMEDVIGVSSNTSNTADKGSTVSPSSSTPSSTTSSSTTTNSKTVGNSSVSNSITKSKLLQIRLHDFLTSGNILCSTHCLSIMLLLVGSDNKETARHAVKTVAALSSLPCRICDTKKRYSEKLNTASASVLGYATGTGTHEDIYSSSPSSSTPLRICLRCGAHCDQLSPIINVAHMLSCYRLYYDTESFSSYIERSSTQYSLSTPTNNSSAPSSSSKLHRNENAPSTAVNNNGPPLASVPPPPSFPVARSTSAPLWSSPGSTVPPIPPPVGILDRSISNDTTSKGNLSHTSGSLRIPSLRSRNSITAANTLNSNDPALLNNVVRTDTSRSISSALFSPNGSKKLHPNHHYYKLSTIPLLSYHCPMLLLSPDLFQLVPPARYGPLVLLLSMVPSPNTLISEAALHGIYAIAKAQPFTIIPIIGFVLLPLLVAAAADTSTPLSVRNILDDLLRVCGFPKGINDVIETCDRNVALTLAMWRTKWQRTIRHRLLFQRYISRLRAWESVNTYHQYHDARLRLARHELSTPVLNTLLRQCGLPIPLTTEELLNKRSLYIRDMIDTSLTKGQRRLAALCHALARCTEIEFTFVGLLTQQNYYQNNLSTFIPTEYIGSDDSGFLDMLSQAFLTSFSMNRRIAVPPPLPPASLINETTSSTVRASHMTLPPSSASAIMDDDDDRSSVYSGRSSTIGGGGGGGGGMVGGSITASTSVQKRVPTPTINSPPVSSSGINKAIISSPAISTTAVTNSIGGEIITSSPNEPIKPKNSVFSMVRSWFGTGTSGTLPSTSTVSAKSTTNPTNTNTGINQSPVLGSTGPSANPAEGSRLWGMPQVHFRSGGSFSDWENQSVGGGGWDRYNQSSIGSTASTSRVRASISNLWKTKGTTDTLTTTMTTVGTGKTNTHHSSALLRIHDPVLSTDYNYTGIDTDELSNRANVWFTNGIQAIQDGITNGTFITETPENSSPYSLPAEYIWLWTMLSHITERTLRAIGAEDISGALDNAAELTKKVIKINQRKHKRSRNDRTVPSSFLGHRGPDTEKGSRNKRLSKHHTNGKPPSSSSNGGRSTKGQIRESENLSLASSSVDEDHSIDDDDDDYNSFTSSSADSSDNYTTDSFLSESNGYQRKSDNRKKLYKQHQAGYDEDNEDSDEYPNEGMYTDSLNNTSSNPLNKFTYHDDNRIEEIDELEMDDYDDVNVDEFNNGSMENHKFYANHRGGDLDDDDNNNELNEFGDGTYGGSSNALPLSRKTVTEAARIRRGTGLRVRRKNFVSIEDPTTLGTMTSLYNGVSMVYIPLHILTKKHHKYTNNTTTGTNSTVPNDNNRSNPLLSSFYRSRSTSDIALSPQSLSTPRTVPGTLQIQYLVINHYSQRYDPSMNNKSMKIMRRNHGHSTHNHHHHHHHPQHPLPSSSNGTNPDTLNGPKTKYQHHIGLGGILSFITGNPLLYDDTLDSSTMNRRKMNAKSKGEGKSRKNHRHNNNLSDNNLSTSEDEEDDSDNDKVEEDDDEDYNDDDNNNENENNNDDDEDDDDDVPPMDERDEQRGNRGYSGKKKNKFNASSDRYGGGGGNNGKRNGSTNGTSYHPSNTMISFPRKNNASDEETLFDGFPSLNHETLSDYGTINSFAWHTYLRSMTTPLLPLFADCLDNTNKVTEMVNRNNTHQTSNKSMGDKDSKTSKNIDKTPLLPRMHELLLNENQILDGLRTERSIKIHGNNETVTPTNHPPGPIFLSPELIEFILRPLDDIIELIPDSEPNRSFGEGYQGTFNLPVSLVTPPNNDKEDTNNYSTDKNTTTNTTTHDSPEKGKTVVVSTIVSDSTRKNSFNHPTGTKVSTTTTSTVSLSPEPLTVSTDTMTILSRKLRNLSSLETRRLLTHLYISSDMLRYCTPLFTTNELFSHIKKLVIQKAVNNRYGNLYLTSPRSNALMPLTNGSSTNALSSSSSASLNNSTSSENQLVNTLPSGIVSFTVVDDSLQPIAFQTYLQEFEKRMAIGSTATNSKATTTVSDGGKTTVPYLSELAVVNSPQMLSDESRASLTRYITNCGTRHRTTNEDYESLGGEPLLQTTQSVTTSPTVNPSSSLITGTELGIIMFGMVEFRNTLPWLQHLDLTGNNLGDDGCADIIWALATPYSTIRSCNLSFNNIVGGVNLLEALTMTGEGLFYRNTSLRSLNLCSNQFSESAAARILKVLGNCKYRYNDNEFTDRNKRQASLPQQSLSGETDLGSFQLDPSAKMDRSSSAVHRDTTHRHPSKHSTGDDPMHNRGLPTSPLFGGSGSSTSSGSSSSSRNRTPITRLSSLSLAACGLYSKLVSDALIYCLENNKTLRELDLSSNHLSSETGSRIVVAVTYHMKYFWYLRLANNGLIRNKERRQISQVLRKRRALWSARHIDSSNQQNETVFQHILERNKQVLMDRINPSPVITTPATSVSTTNQAVSTGDKDTGTELITNDNGISSSMSTIEPTNTTVPVEENVIPAPKDTQAEILSKVKATDISKDSTNSIRRLHVIALFASPLVYYMNDGSLVSMQQLDIQTERMAIWNGLHNGQTLMPTVASKASTPSSSLSSKGNTFNVPGKTVPLLECGILSLSNLRRVLTYGADILHISCHGGIDWIALEGITGETVFLGENNLRSEILAASSKSDATTDTDNSSNNNNSSTDKETILRNCLCNEDGLPRIRLVILAACQSHWAASIFSEAGVPHVLCVEPSTDILDDACLTFISEFYMTLCSSPFTTSVRTAYNVGIQAMRTFLVRSGGSNNSTSTPKDNTVSVSPFAPTPLPSSSASSSTAVSSLSSRYTTNNSSAWSYTLNRIPPMFLLYPPTRMTTEIHIETNTPTPTNPNVSTENDSKTADDPHNVPLLSTESSGGGTVSLTYNFWQENISSTEPSTITQQQYAGTVDDYGPSWARLYQGNKYSNVQLPSLPEHFCGRTRAIHNILLDLLGSRKARIITLAGRQGIGKSAVSIGLSQWLALHRSFPDGIVYIDCHRINTLSSFVLTLTNTLLSNVSLATTDHNGNTGIGQVAAAQTGVEVSSSTSLHILARNTQDLLYSQLNQHPPHYSSSSSSTASSSYDNDNDIDSRIKLSLANILHHLHAKRMLVVLDGIDGVEFTHAYTNDYYYSNGNYNTNNHYLPYYTNNNNGSNYTYSNNDPSTMMMGNYYYGINSNYSNNGTTNNNGSNRLRDLYNNHYTGGNTIHTSTTTVAPGISLMDTSQSHSSSMDTSSLPSSVYPSLMNLDQQRNTTNITSTEWTGIMDLSLTSSSSSSSSSLVAVTFAPSDGSSSLTLSTSNNVSMDNTDATIVTVENDRTNRTDVPVSSPSTLSNQHTTSTIPTSISLSTATSATTTNDTTLPLQLSPSSSSVNISHPYAAASHIVSSSYSTPIPSIPLLPSVLQTVLTTLLSHTLSCQFLLTRRHPLGGNSLRTSVEVIHHLQPLAPEDAAYLLTRLSSSTGGNLSSSSGSLITGVGDTDSNSSFDANRILGTTTSSSTAIPYEDINNPSRPLLTSGMDSNTTDNNAATIERRALAIAKAVGGIPSRLMETVHVLRQFS